MTILRMSVSSNDTIRMVMVLQQYDRQNID